MITMAELNPTNEDVSREIAANLNVLLERMNRVRTKWGKPMKVTSPLRTMANHIRIYEEKAKKAGVPFDRSKVPMFSKHLFGQAVDIYDPDQSLQKWCRANEAWLLSIGLWMESFDATPNWCHFQIVPYGSWKAGKSIFFNP